MTAGYVVSRAGAAKLLAHRQPLAGRLMWTCASGGMRPAAHSGRVALGHCAGRHQRGQQHLGHPRHAHPGQRWRKFTMKLALTLGNAAPPPFAQTLIRGEPGYARAPAIAGSGCASWPGCTPAPPAPALLAQACGTGRVCQQARQRLRQGWRIAFGHQQPRLAGLHHAAHAHHVRRHAGAACRPCPRPAPGHAFVVGGQHKIWWLIRRWGRSDTDPRKCT